MNKHALHLLAIISIFSFTACSSNEIGESKDVAADKIYQGYSIRYSEGEKEVTLRAQYRFAGKNGTTLVLSKPSYIAFDYVRLEVDSSDGSGAYYATRRDTGLMLGAKHSFVFAGIDKKEYENSFMLNIFKLENVPAEASRKKPLVLTYTFEPGYQLQKDDYIEVSSSGTDSSFNYTFSSKDTPDQLLVPVTDLKKQKGKTLTLDITLYRNVAMQQVTSEGGAMEIKYALKPVTLTLTD